MQQIMYAGQRWNKVNWEDIKDVEFSKLLMVYIKIQRELKILSRREILYSTKNQNYIILWR